MRTAVVFVGGDPPHPRVLMLLPAERTVIAADSGYDHARAAGVEVDLVVGDLDSISAAGLAELRSRGTTVDQHPSDKDLTDTELALRAGAASGASVLLVVSGGGDRLDHSIGAIMALADPALGDVHVEAWWGTAHIVALRGPRSCRIEGRVGDTISLLPVGGPAAGLTVRGVQYPLDGETLHPTASRGVSNVFTESIAHIEIGDGALLVVRPHALDGEQPPSRQETRQ